MIGRNETTIYLKVCTCLIKLQNSVGYKDCCCIWPVFQLHLYVEFWSSIFSANNLYLCYKIGYTRKKTKQNSFFFFFPLLLYKWVVFIRESMACFAVCVFPMHGNRKESLLQALLQRSRKWAFSLSPYCSKNNFTLQLFSVYDWSYCSTCNWRVELHCWCGIGGSRLHLISNSWGWHPIRK